MNKVSSDLLLSNTGIPFGDHDTQSVLCQPVNIIHFGKVDVPPQFHENVQCRHHHHDRIAQPTKKELTTTTRPNISDYSIN